MMGSLCPASRTAQKRNISMLLDKTPNPGTQLEAMLQAFPDLLFTLDQNGVLLDYKGSEHVSTLFASADALIGQKLADVLPHDFGGSLRQALGELDRAQGPVSFEYSSKQGGVTRWFETRLVRAPADQIIVIVRDATRHKEAEERIKAQLRRMASLRSIDLAISSSLDLHLALSVILSQVTAELGVDAADILLLNNRNILEYVTGVGFRTDAMKSTNLRLGQAYAGAVAAKGESHTGGGSAQRPEGIPAGAGMPAGGFSLLLRRPTCCQGTGTGRVGGVPPAAAYAGPGVARFSGGACRTGRDRG